MIKFFRKIRQNLIAEGKTVKYLKYVIGEIILVVIGILIALQINNWNQNKQLKKEEVKILKSLQKAIEINIDEFKPIFNAQIERNESLQEVIFIKVSDKQLGYLDSLITINVRNHTFDPSTGIYNSMINSGKLELVTNDSLKNKLSKLYDKVRDYQESEDEVTAYTKEHLEKYFIDNYNINPEILAGIRGRTDDEEKNDRASYTNTFNSQKVKNMYILLLNKMSDIMLKGESLKSEYQSLVTDLENEIESKE